MNIIELQHHLNSLHLAYDQLSQADRIEAVSLLISAADIGLKKLRKDLFESDAATNQRKAKQHPICAGKTPRH
jgi:hypothetical protein